MADRNVRFTGTAAEFVAAIAQSEAALKRLQRGFKDLQVTATTFAGEFQSRVVSKFIEMEQGLRIFAGVKADFKSAKIVVEDFGRTFTLQAARVRAFNEEIRRLAPAVAQAFGSGQAVSLTQAREIAEARGEAARALVHAETPERKGETDRLRRDILAREEQGRKAQRIIAEIEAAERASRERLLAGLKADILAREAAREELGRRNAAQLARQEADEAASRARTLARLRADITRRAQIQEEVNRNAVRNRIDDEARAAAARQKQLAKLKAAIIARHNVEQRETRRSVKATNELTLSWRTLLRLAQIQILHRVVATFVQNVREGIEETKELSKAIAEVRTIAETPRGFTESQTEWLVAAIELSSRFGIALKDEVEAAYQGLSNQVINTTLEFEQFGATADRFAITARTSVAGAVNLLTASLNAFRDSVDEAERHAAIFFKTIELGRVRAEEMENAFGRISVPAATLGVRLEELNSLITIATIRGLKYNEVATQIRGVLVKLIKPTKEMSAFLNELGFESGEAAIEGLGFVNFLRLMQERTQGSSTEIAKLVPRIRGLNLAMLLGTRQGLSDYNRTLQEISQSTDDFREKSEIALKSLGQRFEIEIQQVRNLFIKEFGFEFLEFLDSLPGGLESISNAVSVIASVVKGTLIPAIGLLIGALVRLGITMVSTPVGAIAAALGGALTLFQLAKEAVDDYSESFREQSRNRVRALQEEMDEQRRILNLQLAQFRDTVTERRAIQARELAIATRVISEVVKDAERALGAIESLFDTSDSVITTLLENSVRENEKLINDLIRDVESIDQAILDVDQRARDRQLEQSLVGKNPVEQFRILGTEAQRLRKEIAEAFELGEIDEAIQKQQRLNQLTAQQQEIQNRQQARQRERFDPRTGRFRGAITADEQAILNTPIARIQDDDDRRYTNQLETAKKIQDEARLGLQFLTAQIETEIEGIKAAAEEIAGIIEDGVSGESQRTIDAERQLRLARERFEVQRLLDENTGETTKAREVALESLRAREKTLAGEREAAVVNEFAVIEGGLRRRLQVLEDPRFREEFDEQRARIQFLPEELQLDALNQLRQDELDHTDAIAQARTSLLDVVALKETEIANIRLRHERDRDIGNFRRLSQERDAIREQIRERRQGIIEEADLFERIRGEAGAVGGEKFSRPFVPGEHPASILARTRILQGELRDSPLINLLTGSGAGETGLGDAQEIAEAIHNAFRVFAVGGTAEQRVSLVEQLQRVIAASEAPSALGGAKEFTEESLTLREEIRSLIETLQSGFTPDEDRTVIEQLGRELKERTLGIERLTTEALPPEELLASTMGNLTSTMEDLIAVISRALDEERKTRRGTAFIPDPNNEAARLRGEPQAFGGLARAIPGTDQFLTPTSAGEFVMNPRSSRQFISQLLTMNAGLVPIQPRSNSGSNFSFGDINVTAPGGDPKAIATEVHNVIRRGVRRGTLSDQ
jgi:TP901 family phage tail tape measure protein